MVKRFAVWVALLFALPTALRADALDDLIRKNMERDHVPGVCLAAISPQGEAMYRNYGVSNLELATPFTAKSVFRIASLSKQFCAYTVLCLAKEGKLSIDDPVTKYLKGAPAEWEAIQIRHLLNHTSGIAEPGTAFSYSKDYTLAEYVDLLARKPLAEKPGTAYRYNNFAYGLLGQLAELAGGAPLPNLVKSRVFDRVGMTSTKYYDPEELTPLRVDAYRWRDGRYTRPSEDRPKVFQGSGGIMSTMEDMVKYELALRDGKSLDPEILRQQWKTQVPGVKFGYGFGWHVADDELRHTGTTFGFKSAFLRSLKSGWTVIAFMNADGVDSMEWASEILKTRLAG